MEECKKENIKAESTHTGRSRGKESVGEKCNEINYYCTVETQCNKCELPSNHFFYCIPLLFYFICTLATQFHIFLHKFIDMHYRTLLHININTFDLKH
jgi:hypothetical protein